MSSERSYPTVPESFTVITGEEVVIEEKQEQFFLEVIDFLGYTDPNTRRAFVEIEQRNLSFSGTHLDVSDDWIAFLLVQSSLIASVIRHRDDLNYVEARFAHYLNPELVELLRFK